MGWRAMAGSGLQVGIPACLWAPPLTHEHRRIYHEGTLHLWGRRCVSTAMPVLSAAREPARR